MCAVALGSETGRCLSVAGYVAATGPRSGGDRRRRMLVLAILGPGPSLAPGCSSSRCVWAIPEGGRPNVDPRRRSSSVSP